MNNNWINKLDIPLDLIIKKNNEIKCYKCNNMSIYYCFNCKYWHCICKHKCNVCRKPVENKLWINFICKCNEMACNNEKSQCIKICEYCKEIYCRKCTNRHYLKNNKYVCKYCIKYCQSCNEKTNNGLTKCEQCNKYVCNLCNYSIGLCIICRNNLLFTTRELIKKYSKLI